MRADSACLAQLRGLLGSCDEAKDNGGVVTNANRNGMGALHGMGKYSGYGGMGGGCCGGGRPRPGYGCGGPSPGSCGCGGFGGCGSGCAPGTRSGQEVIKDEFGQGGEVTPSSTLTPCSTWGGSSTPERRTCDDGGKLVGERPRALTVGSDATTTTTDCSSSERGPWSPAEQGLDTQRFTSLFVKCFPQDWDESKLEDVFGGYGPIISTKLVPTAWGQKFAFINFEHTEDAQSCVRELHRRDMRTPAEKARGGAEEADVGPDGHPNHLLYVQRAQSKAERQAALQENTELFVRNLPEDCSNKELRELFSPYGTVESAMAVKDGALRACRGFGFVRFTTTAAAGKAAAAVHTKLLRGHSLSVGFSERRGQAPGGGGAQAANPSTGGDGGTLPSPRQPQEASHLPHGATGAGPGSTLGIGPGAGSRHHGSMHTPPGLQPMQGTQPPFPTGWGQPGYAAGGFDMRLGHPHQIAGRGGYCGGCGAGGGCGGCGPGCRGCGCGAVGGSGGPCGNCIGPMQNHSTVAPETRPAVDLAALVAASPEVRRQMLGERLYPLVAKYEPQLAGKVTGMFLEQDESELIFLLESREHEVKRRVEEAVQALRKQSGSMSQR